MPKKGRGAKSHSPTRALDDANATDPEALAPRSSSTRRSHRKAQKDPNQEDAGATDTEAPTTRSSSTRRSSRRAGKTAAADHPQRAAGGRKRSVGRTRRNKSVSSADKPDAERQPQSADDLAPSLEPLGEEEDEEGHGSERQEGEEPEVGEHQGGTGEGVPTLGPKIAAGEEGELVAKADMPPPEAEPPLADEEPLPPQGGPDAEPVPPERDNLGFPDPDAENAVYPNNLAVDPSLDLAAQPSADVFHDHEELPTEEPPKKKKPDFDYSDFDAGLNFDFSKVDVFKPPTPEETTPRTPPIVGKMFLIPRDYRKFYTMEVEDITRDVRVYPNGGPLGKLEGKFQGCFPSATGDKWYCMPWNTGQVVELDLMSGEFTPMGDDLGHDENKFGKAIASLNFHGKIYAPPCKAQKVLEIDPTQGTAKEIGVKLGRAGLSKWFACAVSPATRRIYCVPYDAERVLEIDPGMHGQAREIGPSLGDTRGKYMCIEAAPNGCLFAAPLNASRVLMIDQIGNISLVGPDLGERDRKYSSIILAPNKLLYAPPLRANRALEINCARGDTREIGPEFGAGESKWACGCVADNGNIYCPPLEARKVLEIRCEDHEVQEIGCDIGIEDVRDEKYACIAKAPVNRRLYAAPRESHFILEIDPDRGFVREVGIELGRMERKFTAIVTGVDTRLLG